ncbi:MAG: hypothetical protein OEV36_02675 [Myxococcales bacterium]|nr:hypothetical protein [Myxococcales bacterium]
MHRSHLLALVLLALLCGCTSKPARDEQPRSAAPSGEASESAATKKRPTRNFDSQGRLIPSDDYVVGIRLPRGAELFREEELLHVYRIRAPIDKVLAYFGPMMITGSVERQGKGAVYRRASVRGAEVNPTKVDVSVLEVGSGMTRISVTELPPPPQHIPSSDQTKAAAKDSFRMLD